MTLIMPKKINVMMRPRTTMCELTHQKRVQNCQVKVLVSLEVTMCSRIKNLMGARLSPSHNLKSLEVEI